MSTKRSYSSFSYDYTHRTPPSSPEKPADRFFLSRSSSSSLSDQFYFSTLSTSSSASTSTSYSSNTNHLTIPPQIPHQHPTVQTYSSSSPQISPPPCQPSNLFSSFLPAPPISSPCVSPSPYSQSLLSELYPSPASSPFISRPAPVIPPTEPFISSSSPLSPSTQHLLKSLPKIPRKISLLPIRILEAPLIKDDFYLNLIEWSSTNILAVALSNSVYLYHPSSSLVTLLLSLPSPLSPSSPNSPHSSPPDPESGDSITGVSWMPNGENLAVGTNRGKIEIWNVEKKIKVLEYTSHRGRVGAMTWNEFWGNGNLLTTGSRDRTIIHRDIRQSSGSSNNSSVNNEISMSSKNAGLGVYNGHKQEVCGLKWSTFDGFYLASGGNDNKLFVWDIRTSSSSSSNNVSNSLDDNSNNNNNRSSTTRVRGTVQPLFKFEEHTAAVKAIAWSPHKRHILASGGGTADRRIRFWKASTGEKGKVVDTGSQVCNLAWSKNVNELVSTHGYSQHQIVVWSYPGMEVLATLTGHGTRVLYLSVSPEGSTIVTGAGDETLRFWKVFPGEEEMAEMRRKRSRGSGGSGREFGGERKGVIR